MLASAYLTSLVSLQFGNLDKFVHFLVSVVDMDAQCAELALNLLDYNLLAVGLVLVVGGNVVQYGLDDLIPSLTHLKAELIVAQRRCQSPFVTEFLGLVCVLVESPFRGVLWIENTVVGDVISVGLRIVDLDIMFCSGFQIS